MISLKRFRQLYHKFVPGGPAPTVQEAHDFVDFVAARFVPYSEMAPDEQVAFDAQCRGEVLPITWQELYTRRTGITF